MLSGRVSAAPSACCWVSNARSAATVPVAPAPVQTSAKQHPWRWRGSRHSYHRNGGGGADDRPLPATESEAREALVSSRQRLFKDCRLHCGGYTNQQVPLIFGAHDKKPSKRIVAGRDKSHHGNTAVATSLCACTLRVLCLHRCIVRWWCLCTVD